jgi:hypothetical protein
MWHLAALLVTALYVRSISTLSWWGRSRGGGKWDADADADADADGMEWNEGMMD